MTAIAKDQLKPYALGHLGLAGAFIRECGLIEKIDSLIPKESNNAGHFTHGQVVALMILIHLCNNYKSILRGSKRQALFLIKPENFLPVSNHSLTY